MVKEDLFQKIEHSHLESPHHFLKGALLILLSFLLATFGLVLVRDVQKTTSIPVILVIQNFIGLLFTFPSVLKRYLKKEIKQQPFGLLSIRSIFGQINGLMIFLAIKSIPLADAVLLNNTTPMFIPFVAFFWLKNKIDLKIWPGIILGFLGVFLILKPTAQILESGAFFALIGAFFLSFAMIALQLLSSKEKGLIVMFYFFLTGFVVFLPMSILFWTTPSLVALIEIVSIGLLTVIAQLTLVVAFRFATAAQLGPFTYSAVVYSAIFDWLIWNHVPGLLSIIGMILVTVGGTSIILLRSPLIPPLEKK